MSYSIAIRTLGKSGEKFVRELESIKRQTIQPERVIVYIADGYKRPEFTIGKEEYVWVRKGMVAQRALRYDEINSQYIMLLDDDVELADDSAERLLSALEINHLDCIAAETFHEHSDSVLEKLRYAIANFVFPHWSSTWAFKFHSNGCFSYNNHVERDVYIAQTAAGPASVWKKSTLLKMRLEDELWLDDFGFSYGDDGVIFNKLYKNGHRLGVHYHCGVINLDAKSSSGEFQRDPKKFLTRSMASFLIWHRTCFNLDGASFFRKSWAVFTVSVKILWLLFIHLGLSIYMMSYKVFAYYVQGIIEGLKTIHTEKYKGIPNFILPHSE